MSRITDCFKALKTTGKKALIPYITAGDPSLDVTADLMHELVDAGADIIELGVPFSDPMADGPVIQLACERSLAQGTRLQDVLDLVAHFRQSNSQTPVVLMGYLNPIEAMGYEAFAVNAERAGVDGVLTVDLPPEESRALVTELRQRNIDAIYLLAPTTEETRIASICEYGSGYIYYVSVKGVTGSAALDINSVAQKLAKVRHFTSLPVGVGFGIRDGESAAAVSQVADGVIVGSVLVNAIADNQHDKDRALSSVHSIVASMRDAMDQVK